MYPVALLPRNGQNMALLWPKHGPHMVHQIGSSWFLIIVPRDVPCQISHCWVYPVAPFLRNGWYMAHLLPKHGPNMVPQISASLILIGVPRDAACQIWHCRVYPVAPFSRKGQNMPLFLAKSWFSHGPSNCFFLNVNHCAQGCSISNFTLLSLSCSPLF